jgi:hypothetical protein
MAEWMYRSTTIEVMNEIGKLLGDKLNCRKTEISYNCCERSAARTGKKDIYPLKSLIRMQKNSVRPALNKFRNGVCHFLLPLQPMDWINLK